MDLLKLLLFVLIEMGRYSANGSQDDTFEIRRKTYTVRLFIDTFHRNSLGILPEDLCRNHSEDLATLQHSLVHEIEERVKSNHILAGKHFFIANSSESEPCAESKCRIVKLPKGVEGCKACTYKDENAVDGAICVKKDKAKQVVFKLSWQELIIYIGSAFIAGVIPTMIICLILMRHQKTKRLKRNKNKTRKRLRGGDSSCLASRDSGAYAIIQEHHPLEQRYSNPPIRSKSSSDQAVYAEPTRGNNDPFEESGEYSEPFLHFKPEMYGDKMAKTQTMPARKTFDPAMRIPAVPPFNVSAEESHVHKTNRAPAKTPSPTGNASFKSDIPYVEPLDSVQMCQNLPDDYSYKEPQDKVIGSGNLWRQKGQNSWENITDVDKGGIEMMENDFYSAD